MRPTHGLEKIKLYKAGDVFIAEDWGKIQGAAILLPERDIEIVSVSVMAKQRPVVRCECDIKGKMILSDPNTLPLYKKATNASRKVKTSTSPPE